MLFTHFDQNCLKFELFIYIYHSRFRALYKGLVPKVLRLGPGGAIMLIVYDHMHVYLTNKFKD